MDRIVLPEVTTEQVMRCEVSGGFIEVRFTHKMTAEDLDDLICYLEVWKRHRLKGERGERGEPVASPMDVK